MTRHLQATLLPLLLIPVWATIAWGQGDPAAVDREFTLPARTAEPPVIDVWYGDRQTFGTRGSTQPLVNVLGSIRPARHAADVWYRLNGGKRRQLVRGPDLHRLARPGDFNVELDRSHLRKGENTLQITMYDLWGRKVNKEVVLDNRPDGRAELPFEVDFSKVENLQEAVEVIDGRWELVEDGVRIAEPYYDRQLAFGDASWQDFELHAEIVFHEHFVGFRGRNRQGPPYLSHAHTSFNMRWAGHPDDGAVPRRAWQNLGSLVALRSDLATPAKGSYWWLHYGVPQPGRKAKRSEMTPEKRFQIELGERYHYRMRAETLDENRTRYSTKVWKEGDPEPDGWQTTGVDESESVRSGSIVFVVHHSDVTLCRVRVERLPAKSP